jgi:FixJ family two-component response regulator
MDRDRSFSRHCPVVFLNALIVDLQMPEMNGLELQQYLLRNGIKIPTILITAHGDAALSEHEGGLVASLRKPLQKEALFAAIDRALGG